ncbi:O-antigen ligase family protein [Mucilaginibacter sp. SP1R1]|uniref:O-antigen ligase family protein n=1 Tax=Mucilaginibacter sp. SP1R1 TaxID=2723091 RepID=UPI00160F3796|nr:O-antigen ligase family protein [Mucilaginibacter sp. SP1R1]MBB6151360.1 O-antigen ligase [Mucilaginibacter sp. SP1R1]
MKELLLINDSKANKVSYYHIMLLMASLPFDLFYSHIILISFALHTFIHLKKEKLKSLLSVKMLVLPSVLFVSIVATACTTNMRAAFTEWTLRIPLLLFPLLFSLTELDLKKYRSNLLLAFSLICSGTIFYLYADALYTIRYYHLPLRALFAEGFTNHNFAQPINIHATFFSFQLVIALVNLLYLLMIGASPRFTKALYIACSMLLIAGIIQLSSKSILLVLFVIVNMVLPYCLLQGKSRKKFIFTGLAISVLLGAGILSIPTFRDRYVTLFRQDLSVDKTLPRNSDSRIERWHVAAERIKQKPFIGYGSGSEINLLHNDFYKAKMYSSFLYGLNAHNQYISFTLKSGIWGLLIYLFTLGYGFKMSFRKKDVVFISFMLVITVVSFAENYLDVDKGVMFYGFFFSFFIFYHAEKETVITDNQKPHDYLSPVATNALPVTSYYYNTL